MKKLLPILICILVLFQLGCESGRLPTFEIQKHKQTGQAFIINPFDYTPMTAGIPFILKGVEKESVSIEVKIKGQKGSPDFTKIYDFQTSNIDTQWLPVIGLYADTENTIHVAVHSKSSTKTLFETTLQIILPPIPEEDVKRAKEATITGDFEGDEMIFVQYFTNSSVAKFTAIIYDKQGNIRWYSKIPNAHMYFVHNDQLYLGFKGMKKNHLGIFDFLGKELADYKLNGWEEIHHDIIKNPKGNLVLTVNKSDDSPVEQHLIEFNPDSRQNDKIINHIDLSNLFPNVDELFPDLPASQRESSRADVVHINSVSFYERNGQTIYISSSQRSGIGAVDEGGFPQWYFFPKGIRYKEFNNSRSGERLPASGYFPHIDYTLSPTYANLLVAPHSIDGTPITDQAVTHEGKVRSNVDFIYPFRQHGVTAVACDDSSVTFIVLDNAMFQGFETHRTDAFSRAVCYKIQFDQDGRDESSSSNEDVGEYYGGAVQQLWSKKMDFYAPFLGDSYPTPAGNYIFTFGSIGSTLFGKPDYPYSNKSDSILQSVIIELDVRGNEKGRLTIPTTNTASGVGTYRAERIAF